MKPTTSLFLALAVTMATAHAEVPVKPPLQRYERLWKDSPFTAKPVVEEGPVFNPLEDYVLLGVAPVKSGYRVTLLNKKKPTDPRIIVESDRPSDGFRIIDVVRKKGDPLATVVRMASGSTTGTVGFEDKFLKLEAAPQPQQNNTPRVTAQPGSPPSPAAANASPQRPPRPRIVKPPTPPVPGQPAAP